MENKRREKYRNGKLKCELTLVGLRGRFVQGWMGGETVNTVWLSFCSLFQQSHSQSS